MVFLQSVVPLEKVSSRGSTFMLLVFPVMRVE